MTDIPAEEVPFDPSGPRDSSRPVDVLRQTLGAVAIERIVVVDDLYAITFESVLTASFPLSPDQRAELLNREERGSDASELLGDDDVWRGLLQEHFEGLGEEERAGVLGAIRGLLGESNQPELADMRAGSALADLLEGFDMRTLSLREWQSEQRSLIEQRNSPPTLFLFDRNFVREGASAEEGDRLIQELLSAAPDARVGLLTHTVQLGAEKVEWDEIVREFGDESTYPFVVISKQALIQDASQFVECIRLALLAPSFAELASKAAAALSEAQSAMHRRIRGLSPYEYEMAVFASSREEGVWEPDTLLRLLTAALRTEARTKLRNDPEVERLTSAIRQATAPPIDEASGNDRDGELSPNLASPTLLTIRRDEIYEWAEHLNPPMLPIENGDVFQKDGGSSFVLVAQPCDLMVRTDGQRTPEVLHVALVKVKEASRAAHAGHFELPYYDAQGRTAIADLGRVSYVKLRALDLSVFNQSGECVLRLKQEPPTGLIPTWKERHGRLVEQMTKLAELYEKFRAGRAEAELQKALTSCGMGDPISTTISPDEVRHNLRRVRRIKEPYARALLSRFAHHLARDAFEHDLIMRA